MANIRNLPYHAATAVAHGLPADEALKAITLYPAQITGVDAQLGSLESGKAATLFVSTGDPLDIMSNVTAAYIDGREVDLSDRHKRLWKKYQEKYRQLAPAKAAE
jgi:imidazolonepropionase-like amidohydrolase